ncbi:hypothetical protein LINGRAHAP2_LOCUS24193 [Linum grandiflorum]
MTLDDQFQVASIIDKLPPSWKEFKNVLRYKTKEFSLESLITRLRIEEQARKQDKKEEVLFVSAKRHAAALKPNQKSFKNQGRKPNPIRHNQNGYPRGNQKVIIQPPKSDSSFLCFVCGKPGHMARKCRNMPKTGPSVNLTEEEEPLVAMITEMMGEINLIGNSEGWWLDTSASKHVCKNRAMFKTYTEAPSDKKVMLGTSHTIIVAGTGSGELNFTSGKTRTLMDVLHTLMDVRSEQNLADPLTKGLAREKVQNTSNGMGLMPLEKMAYTRQQPDPIDWRSQEMGSMGNNMFCVI